VLEKRYQHVEYGTSWRGLCWNSWTYRVLSLRCCLILVAHTDCSSPPTSGVCRLCHVSARGSRPHACGILPRIRPYRNLLALVYPTIHTSAKCARRPSHIGDSLVRLWLRWHKLHMPARSSPVSERKSGSSAKCHATFGGLISFLAAPRTVGSTPRAHCCTEVPVRVIEVSSLSGAPFICRSLFSTPSAGTSRVSDSVRSTLDRPRGICPESSATA
jgi:hypothetical protein